MKLFLSSLAVIAVSTRFAYAAKPETFNDVLKNFSEKSFVNLIPTIVAVGLVTFLVGVVSFVRAGDNEEKRTQGQKVMVFGIIVLFMMIAFWGFVGFLTQSIFTTTPGIPNYLPLDR